MSEVKAVVVTRIGTADEHKSLNGLGSLRPGAISQTSGSNTGNAGATAGGTSQGSGK